MATATQVQIRRSPWSTLSVATPVDGELGYDQTNKRLVVGDGVTAGGTPLATESYVQTQVAGFTAGTANNLTLASTCI